MMMSPAAADADIVQSLSAPISPPSSSGVVAWDVDGDGTNDFRLRNTSNLFASFLDSNGGRLVVPSVLSARGVAKLQIGVSVGLGLPNAYKFHEDAQNVNWVTDYAQSGGVASTLSYFGWSYNESGYFGFKFTSEDGTHYGWGEMTIADRGNDGYGDNFIINRAYYESTAGASIQVGRTSVPEPTAVSFLCLLATGAAGLEVIRRRRATALKADEQPQ